MPCGCKKLKGNNCLSCANGHLNVNDWVVCDYWSGQESLPLLTRGNYSKLQSGTVRTKRDALCANYVSKISQPA